MLNEAGFWRGLDNGGRSISVGLGDQAMASVLSDSNSNSNTEIPLSTETVRIDKLGKACTEQLCQEWTLWEDLSHSANISTQYTPTASVPIQCRQLRICASVDQGVPPSICAFSSRSLLLGCLNMFIECCPIPQSFVPVTISPVVSFPGATA